MDIKLNFKRSDLIKPHISSFCYNINIFSNLKKKENNSIDFSELKWVSPLNILPIASLLSNFQKQGYNFNIKKINPEIKSYLKTIKFFKGTHSITYLGKNKNYIPIVSLPNNPNTNKNTEKKVLSCLIDLLLEKIGQNLSNPLGYALSEMFDNIWEHSETEYGWFLAQYYKNKKYIDICFLDNGISIKGAYNKAKNQVSSDIKAIKLALEGKSTKSKKRGFGLRKTEKLITKSSIRGNFLILTGKSGYFSNRKERIFFNLDCYWQGTIIFLRVLL